MQRAAERGTPPENRHCQKVLEHIIPALASFQRVSGEGRGGERESGPTM